MNVTLSLFAGAGAQFFDNNGVPLTGGKIYTYSTGTTAPAVTYTTAAGNVAHANPIILDSAGRIPSGGEIWLQVGAGYKFVVKTSADVLLATYDNVPTSAVAPIANDASAIAYEQGYAVTAGSFVVGQTYQIASLGNTDFTLIGATSNTVGAFFIATGVGSGTGTAYLSTTVQAKLRQTVSVFDFMTAAQIADVQAGTLAIDCLPAFQAALASFPNTPGAWPGSYAGVIEIPPGSYYLSNTWKIDRQVRITGHSSPDGNAPGAVRLIFADGIDGIVFEDYRTSVSGNFADGATLERVYITRKNFALSTGDGIWMRTRARLRDIIIDRFGRHGCRIDATSGASTTQGNANNWEIQSSRFMRNGMDGLFVDGADANAGVAIRLDCSANGRHGIYDSSFLGNTYVACHVDANLAEGYKTDNLNNYCVFVGCYEEGGWTPSSFAGATTVLGGVLAQRINNGGMAVGNGSVSGFVSTKGAATLTVGQQQNITDTALTFSSSTLDVWRLTKEVGRWFLRWANYAPATPLSIYGDGTTPANGYARDLTSNGGIGFSDYYLGGTGQMRFRGVRPSIPTSGNWLRGDIVYDENPVAGGYIGWVCVASGTPGTWKAFGAINV